jgi:hypothetical protein
MANDAVFRIDIGFVADLAAVIGDFNFHVVRIPQGSSFLWKKQNSVETRIVGARPAR